MRACTAFLVAILATHMTGVPAAGADGGLNRPVAAEAPDAQRGTAVPRHPDPGRTRAVAEAERLMAVYRAPLMRGVRLDGLARERAAESLRWLHRTGAYYRHDPYMTGLLMRTYGVMGDYYASYYPSASWIAYAAANRWARWHWFSHDATAELQRDLDRYALAWATVAAAHGSWFWQPDDLLTMSGAGDTPGVRETALEPVRVPQVDEATLGADQRAAWRDLRTRFVFVAASVHQARVTLEQLSRTLDAQGMSLNMRAATTALSMQGFLVDAADLASAHDFERASQALARADYQRVKLRNTTGQ